MPVPSLSIDRTETIQDRRLRLIQIRQPQHCFRTRRIAFLDCFFAIRRGLLDRRTMMARQGTVGASSSSYPDGHIDDLAAQVGNVLADVFGTELVCRTVEILRQLHADVVRAWLRAPVA